MDAVHDEPRRQPIVGELIRRDQDRQTLRRLLLDGAESGRTGPADDAYFASLDERARAGA